MMTMHERLREARLAAGYESAQDVCAAFGWKYSTYIGHENGSRGITSKAATRYASALRVAESWLVFGKGNPIDHKYSLSEDGPAPLTFRESDVQTFVGATATLTATLQKLMELSLPDPRRGFLYTLKAAYLDFGLLPDDVLMATLGAKPTNGQIVIANKVDQSTAEAQTLLCRWIAGQLVPSIQSGLTEISTEDYAILATVDGSLRLPAG